jgi:hypothetical protein
MSPIRGQLQAHNVKLSLATVAGDGRRQSSARVTSGDQGAQRCADEMSGRGHHKYAPFLWAGRVCGVTTRPSGETKSGGKWDVT